VATTKVSKNAREGVRQKPRTPRCEFGHELQRVKVVPGFRGRVRLEWRHVDPSVTTCGGGTD
jgi:hypothetical protein